MLHLGSQTPEANGFEGEIKRQRVQLGCSAIKGWEGEGWHLYLTETMGTVTTVWIRKEYTSCLSLEALALSWWGFGNMINECQCS